MNQGTFPFRYVHLAVATILAVVANSSRAVIRMENGLALPANYPANVAVSVPGGLCGGTVVGNGWCLLSAKHCASAADGVIPASHSINDAKGRPGIDSDLTIFLQNPARSIALVPLESQFAYFVDLYSGAYSVGNLIAFAGNGTDASMPGNGMAGMAAKTLSQGQSVAGFLGSSIPDDNVQMAYNSPGTRSAETQLLQGDSGAFITINDINYLVGANVALSVPFNSMNGVSQANQASSGNNFATFDWILTDGGTSVPEPGTLGMLVIGVGGILFMRRQMKSRPQPALASVRR